LKCGFAQTSINLFAPSNSILLFNATTFLIK
jgi:hypothetical protein